MVTVRTGRRATGARMAPYGGPRQREIGQRHRGELRRLASHLEPNPDPRGGLGPVIRDCLVPGGLGASRHRSVPGSDASGGSDSPADPRELPQASPGALLVATSGDDCRDPFFLALRGRSRGRMVACIGIQATVGRRCAAAIAPPQACGDVQASGASGRHAQENTSGLR